MPSKELRDLGRAVKVLGIMIYLGAWGASCYMAVRSSDFGWQGEPWKTSPDWRTVAFFVLPLTIPGLLLFIGKIWSGHAPPERSGNSLRGRSVRFSFVYWLTLAALLFLLLNRFVTDLRLGLDSRGPNYGAVWAIVLFLPLQLLPALSVRSAVLEPGETGKDSEWRKVNEWRVAWFFSLACPVILGFSLWGMGRLPLSVEDHVSAAQAHGGFYPECIIVPSASVALVVTCWLLRERLRKGAVAAVRIGFVLFLLIVVVGAGAGFARHPRSRMSYSEDYLGKFVYYDPTQETGEKAAAEYYAGKRGASDESRGYGDEDFEYLLALNGLEVLALITSGSVLMLSLGTKGRQGARRESGGGQAA